MNLKESISRGVSTVGQQPGRNPGRKLALLTKDFSSVEQGVPIPVIYGRPKPFAGITITPIFGFRSKKMTTTAGK